MHINGNFKGVGFGIDIPTFTFGPDGFRVEASSASGQRSEPFPDEFFQKYPPASASKPLSLQDKVLLGGLGLLVVGGGLLFLKRRSSPSREG